jgi:hypothetical protein
MREVNLSIFEYPVADEEQRDRYLHFQIVKIAARHAPQVYRSFPSLPPPTDPCPVTSLPCPAAPALT